MDAAFGYYSIVVDIWANFLRSEGCETELTDPKREEGIEVSTNRLNNP